jgi:hypothetical protein
MIFQVLIFLFHFTGHGLLVFKEAVSGILLQWFSAENAHANRGRSIGEQ